MWGREEALDVGTFYLSVGYGVLIVLVTLVNIWRAPPPSGRRLYLLLATVLFVAGTIVEGAEEVGLIGEWTSVWGDLTRLAAVSVLLLMLVIVRRTLEKGEGYPGD